MHCQKNILLSVLLLAAVGCQSTKTMRRGALVPFEEVSIAGTVYYVDNRADNASDENPGTEAEPWKTISRAGAAAELQPGDGVLIKTGVYREHAVLKVSGEPGNPITFSAAPGHKVVIKGSEVVKGPWIKMSDQKEIEEPFPEAFKKLWAVKLGEEFFTDPRFPTSYNKMSKRWVSQVFIDDTYALQKLGPTRYSNDAYARIRVIGKDQNDVVYGTFFFDNKTGLLYVKTTNPNWYSYEVGVRGFVFGVGGTNLVVRGLEVRHNRQPGGQWSMASVGGEGHLIENCKFQFSDFGGLHVGGKRQTIRGCDMSYNGCTGLGMGHTEDVVVEDCTLMFNNYRFFRKSWHAGGMKCIPGNKRTIVRRCVAAYNIVSPGIWFDADNEEIQILDNISHHNGGDGIFYEINGGGGLIANNVSYANQVRGIYISGSRDTWVVHNTVVGNKLGGITCASRGEKWPLKGTKVYNNLLIGNEQRGENCDLVLELPEDAARREERDNTSDYNIFGASSWIPLLRAGGNEKHHLADWRETFGQDRHSVVLPLCYDIKGGNLQLQGDASLEQAGQIEVPGCYGWDPPNPTRVGADISF